MPQFKLRQRLLAIGDDFDITDAHGVAVYKVDDRMLRVRQTWVIETMDGREAITVRRKLIAVRKTAQLLRDGDVVATIRKALISPLRDKFMIDLDAGGELEAKGNILDHEYTISRDDAPVAQISKRWFTIRDTYGIDITDGEDVELMLAIAVAIDDLAREPDENEDEERGADS
jgi:uncharacterized protein YxjI